MIFNKMVYSILLVHIIHFVFTNSFDDSDIYFYQFRLVFFLWMEKNSFL